MKRSAKKSSKPETRQYTIRSVPPEVDRALRERAKHEGRSLNDVALEALARGVGVPNGDGLYHDLDHLIGTWVEDPEFDAIIAEQRQVDPELWR